MNNTSERVIQMKSHFMELHADGKSIKEIAAMYKLSVCTVYSYLGEIASCNELTREELLQRVHKTHKYWEHVKVEDMENIADLSLHLDNAISEVKEIIETINILLEEE